MFREHRSGQPRIQPRSPDLKQREVERWLQLSRTAGDVPTALEYAQHAVALQPTDSRVQVIVQRCLLEQLTHDPFVAFIQETDQNYIIALRDARHIAVPKARAQPEIFPPDPATQAERALGLVWWMVLGLIPAGIGALILMPLAVWRAVRILNKPRLDFREEQLAWLTLFLASGFGVLGLFFALLLSLHLV